MSRAEIARTLLVAFGLIFGGVLFAAALVQMVIRPGRVSVTGMLYGLTTVAALTFLTRFLWLHASVALLTLILYVLALYYPHEYIYQRGPPASLPFFALLAYVITLIVLGLPEYLKRRKSPPEA